MSVQYKDMAIHNIYEVERIVNLEGTEDEIALVNFFLNIIDDLEDELGYLSGEMNRLERSYEG